jgi:hypothetical protein
MTTPLDHAGLAQAALVSLGPTGKTSIPFSYNPETLQRTIEPNTVGGRPGARSRAMRFAGAPAETITLECHIAPPDYVPQPGGAAGATTLSVAPQLAALALLAYPSTADVQAAQDQLDAGVVQINGLRADPLLLVFGERAIPCRVTGLTVVEQIYDTTLTPVLATVTLSLRAVSYSDVDSADPSFGYFMAYQQQLETLSQGATGSSS